MVKWDLEAIYNFKDTDKLISQVQSKVKKYVKCRSELNDSLTKERFMELIHESEEISKICHKLGGYAGLSLSENTSDSNKLAHEAKISQLMSDFSNETIFFDLWFKSISDKKAEELMADSGKYEYFLKTSRFFKKYVLSEKEEQLVTLKDLNGNDALVKIYDIITTRFKYLWDDREITMPELSIKVKSPDRSERKKAYKLLLSKYEENEHSLCEIYKNLVSDWRNENVKVRGFKSPITVRNLSNDISDDIVETLLNVTKKNSKIFHEYFKLKAKVLGIKDFSRFDVYAPLSEIKKKYTYEQSKKIVLDTYKSFSEKAYDYAKEIFDLDHVHSEVYSGKQHGAFCYTLDKDVSPYILLNFTGTLNDVFTMMHEFGHGIHGRSARDQTAFTFHSSLPMAETASIFGETLLGKKIVAESTDDEKKIILANNLDSHFASILRQAYFVIFEKEAHELIANDGTLDDLNELYSKNLKEQFGKDMIIPDYFQHEWKYIPHIFHTPFYCYAYAFGNLLGLSLYKMYEDQGDAFVDNYMKLLAAGGSDSAEKLIKANLGVDISKEEFWQCGFDLIADEVKELKRLVEK